MRLVHNYQEWNEYFGDVYNDILTERKNVKDKDNLMILRQEVDNILNHTTEKIYKFYKIEF